MQAKADEIKVRLQNLVDAVAQRKVGWNESLLDGAIDSIALVEVINFVDQIAKNTGIKIDLDRLISQEGLTMERIHAELAR